MNLEYYTISAICQHKEAAVYAITKLHPTDFTEINRKLFSVATSLYELKKRVDLHVFISQCSGLGIPDLDATHIFHYCLDYDDNWESVFEEFKRVSTYRKISDHTQKIDQLRTNQAPVEVISSKAMQYATEWITGTEKRYLNGKEIDEMADEFGEPIRTGIPLYDSIYKYGGNLKGQMKGVICREKHGKTRSECWEVAQNLRMGHKVLYLTLEGSKRDITGNIKQVLQHEWEQFRENLFVVDGVVDLDELEAITIEAVLVDGVEKVVVDYMQLVFAKGGSENERINTATERFRHLMVKHNFHLSALNQARKADAKATTPKDANGNSLMPNGYKFVPSVYEAYGSNALIKAASIILIGFRPNLYEELVSNSALSKKIVAPNGREESYYSFFMKVERSRYKPENLHKWWQFTDSDNGLQIRGWI